MGIDRNTSFGEGMTDGMGKRAIGIGLILLLVLLTVYSIFLPTYSSMGLTVETTEMQQGDLQITTQTYISPSGKPTVADDKGYAMIIKTVRDGKTILEEYRDDRGKPTVLSAGYSAVKREYTDGLNTEICYLDGEGLPAVISSGYDTIRRTYNEVRLADTDSYWIGEKQVERKQGYWYLKRIYGTGNDRKRVVRQEFLDQEGKLRVNTSGYAYWERTYDEDGRVSVQKYYGPSGSPASIGSGYAGYRREYDEEGRVIQTTYLGENGEAANLSRGYAIVKTVYDPSGTKTLYFDTEGRPATAGRNHFGILTTDAGSTYLNEDGEVLIRLDNLLLTYPVLVLLAGSLVVLAALLVRGRLRVAFLIAYLAFILYMTMAWRENGAVRFRMDLFWSYRQFLTNRSLRLEILNNIWLFVPFGAALQSLMMNRTHSETRAVIWTVLICVILSVSIEMIQLVAGIGLCEADDVISNALGGLLGALMGECLSFHGERINKKEPQAR